uniref:Uncharacterized protein n=1 Tax=Anguilla anguilla TaxID=7936 RepID=A0A0E9Y1F2_ANGAN
MTIKQQKNMASLIGVKISCLS